MKIILIYIFSIFLVFLGFQYGRFYTFEYCINHQKQFRSRNYVKTFDYNFFYIIANNKNIVKQKSLNSLYKKQIIFLKKEAESIKIN